MNYEYMVKGSNEVFNDKLRNQYDTPTKFKNAIVRKHEGIRFVSFRWDKMTPTHAKLIMHYYQLHNGKWEHWQSTIKTVRI